MYFQVHLKGRIVAMSIMKVVRSHDSVLWQAWAKSFLVTLKGFVFSLYKDPSVHKDLPSV